MTASGKAGLFAGPGDVAARARAIDWRATPFGPPDGWPAALRTAVGIAMGSGFATAILWGSELCMLYNDWYIPFLGAKHPAALGRPVHEVWPELRDDMAPLYARVLAGESVSLVDRRFLLERRGPDAPPDERFITTSFSPILIEDGVGGVFATALDTTGTVSARTLRSERDELRGALSGERERVLEEIFHQAPTFLAVLRGPEHVVEMANEAYFELIGRRDIIGRPIGEAFPEVRGQGFIELLDRVLQTGEPFRGRELAVTLVPDGRRVERFVDFVCLPKARLAGGAEGVIAHGYDVTDQVLARREVERLLAESEQARSALAESEARFRAVQDASPDASLLARAVRDDEGEIVDFLFTYHNDATKPVLLGGEESVIGRLMTEAFPESVAAGRLEIYREIVETGRPWQADVHYRRGELAHGLRVSAVKVGDGVHISAVDLTERMRAAEERERLLAEAERARAAAEEANRAKSEFLAIMSHELRTPLNAIGGYAELMELGIRGPITPEQRQDLARIQKSQRHLLGLINGVLNYTRVESGAVDYRIEVVPLQEALATCEALTAPQMRDRRLACTFACDPALRALADREKLQQILLNLLTNAIKFTDPGGRVDVRCEATDATVALVVADTGRGIAADQLERVFEPFVQVERALTRTQEGVGLGLAISRDLARGMHGDLTVASALGAGSVFTLTLPRDLAGGA